jgi:predicted dinucleotide-binding enzyme
MDIGILGSGPVGQALGAGFASLGHIVKIGSREPESEKLQQWLAGVGEDGSIGTFEEAASFGEIIVLATKWEGTENAIALAGEDNFAGKIIIDVTNPLAAGAPPRLALGTVDSGGETVQRWLPGSKVVKAFNTVGAHSMVNPQFLGGPPTMFICGNDEKAKELVADLCDAFGWETVDIGGIEGSRLLEPLAMLWITYGFRTNSWNHAFKLLQK